LKEQLVIIKTACENYDDTAVYEALDKLKDKQWRKDTNKTLEEIYNLLFFNSDFEGAGEQAGRIID